ncbi:hypothetical protein [Yersinia pekkanenii]|uniref:hypothetical protein n=1 Tax=Yersinia pekkanenii TaxID=1288385 RepID=UPI00066FBAD3|nr:hypothetical protein [Yersinia pekkanenii]
MWPLPDGRVTITPRDSVKQLRSGLSGAVMGAVRQGANGGLALARRSATEPDHGRCCRLSRWLRCKPGVTHDAWRWRLQRYWQDVMTDATSSTDACAASPGATRDAWCRWQ